MGSSRSKSQVQHHGSQYFPGISIPINFLPFWSQFFIDAISPFRRNCSKSSCSKLPYHSYPLLRKLHILFRLTFQHIRVLEYFKFVQRLFVRHLKIDAAFKYNEQIVLFTISELFLQEETGHFSPFTFACLHFPVYYTKSTCRTSHILRHCLNPSQTTSFFHYFNFSLNFSERCELN